MDASNKDKKIQGVKGVKVLVDVYPFDPIPSGLWAVHLGITSLPAQQSTTTAAARAMRVSFAENW